MDFFEYDRYIVNAKPGSKPWFLFFMYTPYTGSAPNYETWTNHFEKAICFARSMDMNLAFLDYRAHEEIFESYNYKFGYYDKSVPYYMIAHEGKMHHIQHDKHALSFWID